MKTTVLRRVRFVIFAALFILSFSALSSTKLVVAQETKSGNEFDYFSDDTFTVQVGFVIYCSNGSVFRSGQVTPYSTVTPAGC
jgi:hypothetical protein